MLLENKVWVGTSKEGAVCMLPQMANRHGLISGATGTGKTVTLQVMAEAFSQLGVPVFMSDIKGDLGGLAKPGELNEKINARLAICGVQHFTPCACPVMFWDVFGKSGHPVRATVSEMGPLLLSRMLQLNDTQAGVLHLVFRIADEQNMLLIDLKDLRAMLIYVGEDSQNYTLRYGNISKSSVGAIQRAIAVLEDQGGNDFFAEPALNINDWFVTDEAGNGMINILAADQLFLRPALYSAFMMWMLGELYELLPEQGDSALPRIVFFFDEAHLLFEDCPKELLDKIQLTIRLIRSKGVGVFFITQTPTDIPSSVLSQLSARVQHALRAFTPQEQRVIQAVAQTFRINPEFDTQEILTVLGTGEALVSFLEKDGSPSITQRATILPPQSAIGAITPSLRQTLIEASDLKGKYDEVFDRQSAYELLSAKFASQGIRQTGVVAEIPLKDQPGMTEVAQPTSATMTFRVYDPTTGEYVERRMQAPVQPSVPMQTQQLSAKEQKQAAAKEPRREPSALEKMLANFTRSTASGAGYTVGRSITRNILGVFGIK